jgi:hypothetical protein
MGPLRVETSRVRAASQKNLVAGNGPDLTADWGWKLDGSSSWLRRLRQEEKSRVARGVGGGGGVFVGITAGVEAETALVGGGPGNPGSPGPMHPPKCPGSRGRGPRPPTAARDTTVL